MGDAKKILFIFCLRVIISRLVNQSVGAGLAERPALVGKSVRENTSKKKKEKKKEEE